MDDIVESKGRSLPCMKDSNDHKFYQGNPRATKCKRCEFEDVLHDFIDQHFKEYALHECCDIDCRNSAKPEAVFVNRNNRNDKIAIEVKKVIKVLDDNFKKNNRLLKAENSFNKFYLDKIGEQAVLALQEMLLNRVNQIKEKSYLLYLFLLQHTYITFGYDCLNKTTFKDLFLKMSKTEQEDSYFQFRKGLKEFYMYLLDLLLNPCSISENMYEKDFVITHEINGKMYKLSLNIYFSKHENGPYIQWFDFNPYSEWRPNTNALRNKMMEYFDSCEKKFLSYNCKHVLLLKNESNYFKNYLIENLQKFNKPMFIDEIWCSFYEYDEIYDEEGDFIGESIKGIVFEKIN